MTLAGRELRMRRSGGPANRPRYSASYDRDRGARRASLVGRVYRGSVVLCGPESCATIAMRVRLR